MGFLFFKVIKELLIMTDQQNQIKLIALRISDMREIRGISIEEMAKLKQISDRAGGAFS